MAFFHRGFFREGVFADRNFRHSLSCSVDYLFACFQIVPRVPASQSNKPPQQKVHMSAKLFIGNLPFNATENDLQDHFSQAGAVVSVNIMQDRTTGRSRGFAFIEMASQEAAQSAISLFNQKDFQGRPLTVNEARPREERPPGGGGYRGGGGGGGDRRGGYRDRDRDRDRR